MNRAVQLIQLSKVPHAYWSIASDYKSDIIFIMSLPYFRLYLYLLFVVSSFQWYLDLLITILPPLELSLISVSSSDSVCSPRPITMSQPPNSYPLSSPKGFFFSITDSLLFLTGWWKYALFFFLCCTMAFFLPPWDQSHVFLSLFAVHRFYSLNLKIMGLPSFFNLYGLLSFKH